MILDIDNCIADDSWRLSYINDPRHQQPQFGAALQSHFVYHSLCALDEPFFIGSFEGVYELNKCTRIVFVTGRPECMRAATERWLMRRASLLYRRMAGILMRKNEDARPAAELKPQLIVDAELSPRDVFCAYDDDFAVLDAYRALGLKARRVSIRDRLGPTI